MVKKRLVCSTWWSFEQETGVTAKLQEENTDICTIPGGLTSQLQSLDVRLHKLFKHVMHIKWTEWLMDKCNHEFTPSGYLKKSSIALGHDIRPNCN